MSNKKDMLTMSRELLSDFQRFAANNQREADIKVLESMLMLSKEKESRSLLLKAIDHITQNPTHV